MFKISVYGKGGVGKSSVASNLSYLLSKRGKKVLHIGCDPKHDSTRLLTNGVQQKTFMDSLLDGVEEGVIEEGSNGVSCVECGGAEPGIGCAGKGMISMFSYVERNTPPDTDIRICDVLGDVVCGGFSVPMRRKETDGILIVVSEDFMSVYAGNNILRGIKNLNGTACIIGIVVNSRKPEDRVRVEEFSKATGIPIIATIGNSPAFSEAEAAGKTVAELLPDSESTKQLDSIVDRIMEVMEGRQGKYPAHPLNDNALTQIAAKQPVTDFEPPAVRVRCTFDHVDRERGIVYKGKHAMPACTSHGAIQALLSVKDAAIVLHGPRNCAYLMEYAWLRRGGLSQRLRGTAYPDNLFSSGMNARNMFTGDRKCLRKTIEDAIEKGYRTIFVVQTCTADTIGTDIAGVINDVDRPDIDIVPVDTDEKFLGSKFGAIRGAYRAVVSLMDWTQPVEKGLTALICMQPDIMNDKNNVRRMNEMLDACGLRLGPILLDVATVEELKRFASCEYFIQFGYGPSHKMYEGISREIIPADRKFIGLDRPFTLFTVREWCEKLSEMTGCRESAMAYYQSQVEEFETRAKYLKGRYEGKRAVFYQRSDVYLEPYIDVLRFMGFEVAAHLVWKEQFASRGLPPGHSNSPPMEGDVELCHLAEAVDRYHADLVIAGDPRVGRTGKRWCGTVIRFVGAEGSLEFAEKVNNSMNMITNQVWKGMRP